MLAYLWISLGAIVGASSRYIVGRFVARAVTASFPLGTLLIHITGSFILGLFLVWATERALPDPRWRLMIAIGFCGSYTTFSSYAFESFWLRAITAPASTPARHSRLLASTFPANRR